VVKVNKRQVSKWSRPASAIVQHYNRTEEFQILKPVAWDSSNGVKSEARKLQTAIVKRSKEHTNVQKGESDVGGGEKSGKIATF